MLGIDQIETLFVSPTVSIREATRLLDKGGKGIVLVVDSARRLVGTITDGDLRRAMLAGVDFERPVTTLLERKEPRYRKPFWVTEGTSHDEMIRLMRDQVIRQLPVLDREGAVVGLVTLDDLLPSAEPVDAVIYAHGEHWKHSLLPIGNQSLLQSVIRRLRHAGIGHVRILSNGQATPIESQLRAEVSTAVDSSSASRPSSNGSHGPEQISALQLIITAPILTQVDYRSMIQFHHEHHADMTIAVRHVHHPTAENLVEVDGMFVTGLPRARGEQFRDAGIYLIGPEARRMAEETGCLDPRSLAAELIRNRRRVVSFPIREYWAVVGNLQDYHQVLADQRRGLLDGLFGFEPGTPSPKGTIPLCVPEIRGNEWAYIKECLDTNWVSSVGPFVDSFEASFANYVGSRYAVATCNGTSALHIALLLAGVGPGDEVITSSLSFIAPANAIRYCGAIPRFIDSDREFWQIDPEAIANFLASCRRVNGQLVNPTTGRRVAAVLPVHILGHPCPMTPILELAQRFDLPVIEDATESLGAYYRGKAVGTLGTMACFSFNGNKLITTGGGGMLVTNDADLARRAKYLTTQAKDDPIEFVHGEVGYNYRLTNIQAAMGCAQLEQIDEYIAAKRRIADRYSRALHNISGIYPMAEAEWARHAWWMFTIRVYPKEYGTDSRSLMRHLASRGIQTRPLWQPLHLSPAHRDIVGPLQLPVTERIHAEALSLPCSVGLSDDELDRVVHEIISLAKHTVG